MTPRDLELVAYDAALSEDDETMLATVRQIDGGNRMVIEHALKAWMLRTKYVLMCLASAAERPVAFVIEMHDCDDGDQQKIDPEVAWAGQLFSAYVADDGDQWETLLAALPEELDDLANLLCNILKMLTVVAVSANEDLSQHIATPGPTPMRRSALLAHAHLN